MRGADCAGECSGWKVAARFVAMGLVLSLETVPAAAATVGEIITDRIAIGDMAVPLPDGGWHVAGAGTQDARMAEQGAFGSIENVILFRRQGGRVVAVVEINANLVPVDNGWGSALACERGGQFLLLTRYRSGWDLSCTIVQPTYTPAGGPGPRAWREALRQAAVDGLDVPELWLTAGFRISDRQDLLDVSYHFSPDLLIERLADAPNGPADWAPSSVNAIPDRMAAVRLLSSWAVGTDEWLERGLRDQPWDAPLDMPRRAAFFSNTPQIDAKLRDLELLYRAGALTTQEYLAQQKAGLGEVPVLSENEDEIGRSVEKSLSLRAVNSLIDYGLGFAVAANASISGWLAAPAFLAYSTVFVLNDRLWERQWNREPGPPTAPGAELVHIGTPA